MVTIYNNASVTAMARRRITFAKKISEYLKEIQAAVRDDELLMRSDMINCVNTYELARAPLVGLWTFGNRINPSLSFVRRVHEGSEQIEFEVSESSLASLGYPKNIDEFVSLDNTFSKENYVIHCPTGEISLMHLQALSECLSLICRRSANAANISIALGNEINSMVANKIRWQSGNNFAEALLSAGDSISELIGASSLIFKLSPCKKIQIEHYYSPLIEEDTFLYGKSEYQKIMSLLCEKNYTVFKENITSLPKACSSLMKLGFSLIEYFEKNTLELLKFYEDLVTGTIAIFDKKIIVQPIPVGGELLGDRYFYIFIPKEKLRTRDIYSSSTFSREFTERFKQSKRISLLSNQNRRVSTELGNITKTGIKKEFQKEFRKLAKDTFSVINCHSITVRMKNPANNSLALYAMESTEDADGSDTRIGLESDIDATNISLSEYRTSVNAFTYLFSANGFDYVYLRNLNAQIPIEYGELGLDEDSRYRETSLSEFCMPFKFGDVTIGTVNLESSLKRAFDDDIEFLLLFRSALEDLYKKHFEVFDLEWYKLLTKFADPLHELENYLDTDFFNTAQKAVLKDLFVSDSKIDGRDTNSVLADLKPWFSEWVRSYYQKESQDFVDDVQSIVEFEISRNVSLSATVFAAITAIVKNLITNIEDHSYIRRDKIIISNSPLCQGHSEDEKSLRIRYKTFGYFDDDTLEVFCLRPIERVTTNKNTRHYGAFVLGLLARSVGGYVAVEKSNEGYPVFVEFTIPIQE